MQARETVSSAPGRPSQCDSGPRGNMLSTWSVYQSCWGHWMGCRVIPCSPSRISQACTSGDQLRTGPLSSRDIRQHMCPHLLRHAVVHLWTSVSDPYHTQIARWSMIAIYSWSPESRWSRCETFEGCVRNAVATSALQCPRVRLPLARRPAQTLLQQSAPWSRYGEKKEKKSCEGCELSKPAPAAAIWWMQARVHLAGASDVMH